MSEGFAKAVREEDGMNGLSMPACSQTTREICRDVHSAVLSKHKITSWTTIIAPFGHPGLSVVSEDPSGARREGVLNKTVRFADELMVFLDDAYAEWATVE